MDCPFSCLTSFIVSCLVCAHTVDLAIQCLFVGTLAFQTCPVLLSLGYKMCVSELHDLRFEPAVTVGCYLHEG